MCTCPKRDLDPQLELPAETTSASARISRSRLTDCIALLGVLVGSIPAFRPVRFPLYISCVGAIALLLWLEQPGAVFVWERLPFARFIQFPYRLNLYVALLTAFLASAFLARRNVIFSKQRTFSFTERLTSAAGYVFSIAVVAGVIVTSLAQLPRGYVDLSEPEVAVPTIWRIENVRELIAGTTGLDYLPVWGGDPYVFFKNAKQNVRPLDDSVTPVELSTSQFGLYRFEARATATAPTIIYFERLFYPGWVATVDGRPADIGPSGPLGQLTVRLPAGVHDLRIWYDGTLSDRLGQAVSLLGLFVILGVLVSPGRSAWGVRLAVVVLATVVLAAGFTRIIVEPRPLHAGAQFGDSVRLVAARLDSVPGAPSGEVDVTLLWQPIRSPLAGCSVQIGLFDPQDRIVARRDKPPLFGLRDCSTWRLGALVEDHQQIRLPPGVSPGVYRLAVGLTLDGATQRVSETSVDEVVSGPPRMPLLRNTYSVLGDVSASASPPPTELIGGIRFDATVGGRFALDAARIQVSSTSAVDPTTSRETRVVARVAAGDRLDVDLAWRTISDVATDFSVFTQLIDVDQRMVGHDDGWPDRTRSPTTVRFPGESVVENAHIVTPVELSPGIYTLVTGMYDRQTLRRLPTQGEQTAENQIVLGRIKVANVRHTFGRESPVTPREIQLGKEIALIGAATKRDSSAGPVVVDLVWRAISQPATNYTVFIHVLDPAGRLVAQSDGPPLHGSFPTEFWDPGDTVFDTASVDLPGRLAPGRYNIEVGLYRLDSGARLADRSGADAFSVGSVVVP